MLVIQEIPIRIRNLTIKNVQTKHVKAHPHEMHQIAVNRQRVLAGRVKNEV